MNNKTLSDLKWEIKENESHEMILTSLLSKYKTMVRIPYYYMKKYLPEYYEDFHKIKKERIKRTYRSKKNAKNSISPENIEAIYDQVKAENEEESED